MRLKVDCIVTVGAGSHSCRQASHRRHSNYHGQHVQSPVNEGFIASLARPGGNITGLTNFVSDLAGKRLELLKEAIPKLSRVAFFLDARRPSSDLKWTEAAARLLKIQINSVAVESSEDIENWFRSIVRTRAEAFIPDRGGFFVTHQKGFVLRRVGGQVPDAGDVS